MRLEAVVKQIIYIAMLLGGVLALRAAAQNTSTLEDARRRELDLMNAVTEQERHNSQLRQQIRGMEGTGNELVNASADASALRKKVEELRLRRDVMRDKLDAARRAAIDRYESAPQAVAARKAVDEATAELDTLSRPVLERLSQTPDYQEAQALVEAAAQTGEALQSFPGVDAAAMAKADAAFDQAMARVREMEEAAIAADPKAGEARKTFKTAQDTLDGMRADYEKRLADEAGVVSAQLNFETEERLYNDANTKLAEAEKRAAGLRDGVAAGTGLDRQLKEGEQRLADLNEQLAQAKIARQDAEERQASSQPATASGPAIESGPYYPPVDYTPPPVVYSDPWYGYDYGYSSYPAWGYAPYYGYSYYPYAYRPYCYSSGFYFGFGYYSGYYNHNHHGHGGYGYHHGGDKWHDDRGDRFRDGNYGGYRSPGGSSGSGNHSLAWNRNRDANNSLSAARVSTADAERDYRWRTGAGYSGSSTTAYRSSSDSVMRSSDYERAMRERRASADDGRSRSAESTRTAHVEPRTVRNDPPVSGGTIKSGKTIAARTETNDSIKRFEADRSARAAEEMRRAREASDNSARSSTPRSDSSSGRTAPRVESTPPRNDSSGSRTAPRVESPPRDSGSARSAPRVESAPRSDSGSSRSAPRVESAPRSDPGSARTAPRVESAPRSDSGSARSGGSSSGRGDSGSARSSGSSRSDSGSARSGGGSSAPRGGDSGGSFRSGGGSPSGSARSGGGSSGSSRSSPSGGGSSGGGGRRR